MKRVIGYCLTTVLCLFAIVEGLQAATTGEVTPDFVLQDLTGKSVSLSSYRGRPVYLVFGATWCPYCVAEIPRLTQTYEEYRKKGLVLFNIDVMESKEKVTAFAQKKRITYPILLDEEGKVAERFGVMGVPTRILIDAKGTIICRDCRSLDEKLKQLMP